MIVGASRALAMWEVINGIALNRLEAVSMSSGGWRRDIRRASGN
jgi:hypothetical protein